MGIKGLIWLVKKSIKAKKAYCNVFLVIAGISKCLVIVFTGFLAYLSSLLRLNAQAAINIHLCAPACPSVLTFRIPKKLIKVPNTGSTVLLLLDLCLLSDFRRSILRSYSSLNAVMEICLHTERFAFGLHNFFAYPSFGFAEGSLTISIPSKLLGIVRSFSELALLI